MAAQNRLVLPTFDAKSYNPNAAFNFLRDFETYCRGHEIADAEKPDYLACGLRDNARDWFTQFCLDDVEEGKNWNTMRQSFVDNFTAPVPMAHKAQMAADCRQRSDEDCRAFAIRVANLAYQIVDGLPPAERPTVHATIQPPPAQDGNLPPVIAADITLDDLQTKTVARPFARKQACILFIAGVRPSIREKLLVMKTWTTWTELKDAAYQVEAAIVPAAVAKQTTKFTTHNNLQPVHAVEETEPPAQQQQQQQQPIAPVTNRPKSNNHNRAKGRGRQQQQQHNNGQQRSFKASPHPQQHHSHQAAVTCYYCGGQYHTERHCLAKQTKNASAATSAIIPQPPALYQQPLYQPTPYQPQQQQQQQQGQQQQHAQLYQQHPQNVQDFYEGV